MLLNHSPEKENRSPEGRRREKAAKQIRTAHELLQVLALHNITLSQQLASLILHPHPHPHPLPAHEVKLFGRAEEEAQLRVKLADYEFELKKMGEDFAEFQLLAKMERDKHVRRLREELDFERARNVEDNSKWERKFAERQAQFEQDCEAYRARVEEDSKAAAAESAAKLQSKHEEATHRLEAAHEEAARQLQRALEELRADCEHRLKTEREAHHRELLSLRRTHEAALKEKEEAFETKMVAVESEKKAEIRATEETKKESSKIQEKYLFQIGTAEREKRRLEERLGESEMRCKVLAKRLEDRAREAEELRRSYAEEMGKAESEREHAVENARALLAQEKTQFLREEYCRTEQLELKLLKLEERKEEMQGSYEGLLRTLETRFQRRESKREDLAALRECEEQLVSKQRENSQIWQQLRMVQLEKENNDKIYTRIFTSAKKDKKSFSHKDYPDLALFKHSHTTDFRQLLKKPHK